MRLLLVLFFLPTALLAQESERLETITVSPGLNKQSAPLIRATGSTDDSEGENLRERMPRNLGEATEQMPNVEFTGGPRSQSQLPQIRGLNAERILILEDGVRQNFQSGHNGRLFGDFSLLEDVEVVKGPWSSLYGSGAMGGAISFRRSTAADMIRRTGFDSGVQVALDSASASQAFGQRLTGFGKYGRFEPLLSLRQSNSHDIRLGDGQKLDYSSSQTFDGYSAMTYRPGENQNFTLKLNRFEDRADITLDPESALSTSNLPGESRIVKQDAVGDYNVGGQKWDFHARPFYRRTEVRKQRRQDGRVDQQIVDTTGVDLWNNYRLRSEGFSSVITTGLDFFEDRNDGRRNSGDLASFPDGKGRQLGLYLQPTFTWRSFTLTPGLRYDSYKIEPETGRSNDAENFSAKAYADFEVVPRHKIFAGWGQAFNAPRLQDLYISGMHFPSPSPFVPNNFFIANPDLKPERADTWEAGSKNEFQLAQDHSLSLSGTYFRTEARDFISREVDAAGGTTQFRNRDRVRLEGYELSLMYQWVYLGAGVSYGQVRSLDKSTGLPIADTAADQWSGTVQFYPIEKMSVGTQFKIARKQDKVAAGVPATPGYLVTDFFASYSLKRWEFRARLENALDQDYRPHTSAIKGTGRDFRASVSYLF